MRFRDWDTSAAAPGIAADSSNRRHAVSVLRVAARDDDRQRRVVVHLLAVRGVW